MSSSGLQPPIGPGDVYLIADEMTSLRIGWTASFCTMYAVQSLNCPHLLCILAGVIAIALLNEVKLPSHFRLNKALI